MKNHRNRVILKMMAMIMTMKMNNIIRKN